jgi:predicted glycoside hydrolase/deacetylase ChbG (UPF0249 family)
MKRLVVNADDFGFTRGVNEGIVEAHRRGVLTATTLMANGAAFDDAVKLSARNPTLDVGCHLVLVEGESVLRPGRPLPATPGELVRAVVFGRPPLYEELEAQVHRIVACGIRPTHLDTHKHTHLLPPVLETVARLGAAFGIPWVRRPFDFPIEADGVPWNKRALSGGLSFLRRRFHRTLARHGCRTTDHFAGFQWTGRLQTAELEKLIGALPEGTVELMCHPGYVTEELQAAPTRLKESREAELRALLDPGIREALREAGVALVNYRQLGGCDE